MNCAEYKLGIILHQMLEFDVHEPEKQNKKKSKEKMDSQR